MNETWVFPTAERFSPPTVRAHKSGLPRTASSFSREGRFAIPGRRRRQAPDSCTHQYPAKASLALVYCPFGTGRESASRSDEMSDTKKRCVGFPGDADLCGRSERIGTANGNRNSFSASRDDSRDPALAFVPGSGKSALPAAAGSVSANHEECQNESMVQLRVTAIPEVAIHWSSGFSRFRYRLDAGFRRRETIECLKRQDGRKFTLIIHPGTAVIERCLICHDSETTILMNP